MASSWAVRSVLLRPERIEAMSDVVASADDRGVPVYVAPAEVYDRVAGFPVHRGVLALGERRPDPAPADLLAGGDLVVVAEGLNDHENLGALFRNAAAFSASALLLDPTCCDPLYRRCVRVSVGHVLTVPFARLAPWPASLTLLADAGFLVVALDPSAPHTLASLEEARRGRVALLLGAEGPGLTPGARGAASARARIPMAGGVDSLNVATAAAVALHELRWR